MLIQLLVTIYLFIYYRIVHEVHAHRHRYTHTKRKKKKALYNRCRKL